MTVVRAAAAKHAAATNLQIKEEDEDEAWKKEQGRCNWSDWAKKGNGYTLDISEGSELALSQIARISFLAYGVRQQAGWMVVIGHNVNAARHLIMLYS